MKATRKSSTTRPRTRSTPAQPAEPAAGRPAWLPPHIPDQATLAAQVGALRAAMASGQPGAMKEGLAVATALERAYGPCCAAYAAHAAKGDSDPAPEEVCDYLLDAAGALRWPVAESGRTDDEAVWAKAALAAEVMRDRFGGLPRFADVLARSLRAAVDAQARRLRRAAHDARDTASQPHAEGGAA
jgi:hypothetical protein